MGKRKKKFKRDPRQVKCGKKVFTPRMGERHILTAKNSISFAITLHTCIIIRYRDLQKTIRARVVQRRDRPIKRRHASGQLNY